MLETARTTFPDTVAGVADPGSADKFAGDNVDALSHVKTTARVAKLLGELGDYELLASATSAESLVLRFPAFPRNASGNFTKYTSERPELVLQ